MELLDKLIEIENQMDLANGEKGELCLYCKSKEHNGQVGIVHTETCAIIIIRKLINFLKIPKEDISLVKLSKLKIIPRCEEHELYLYHNGLTKDNEIIATCKLGCTEFWKEEDWS